MPITQILSLLICVTLDLHHPLNAALRGHCSECLPSLACWNSQSVNTLTSQSSPFCFSAQHDLMALVPLCAPGVCTCCSSPSTTRLACSHSAFPGSSLHTPGLRASTAEQQVCSWYSWLFLELVDSSASHVCLKTWKRL